MPDELTNDQCTEMHKAFQAPFEQKDLVFSVTSGPGDDFEQAGNPITYHGGDTLTKRPAKSTMRQNETERFSSQNGLWGEIGKRTSGFCLGHVPAGI